MRSHPFAGRSSTDAIQPHVLRPVSVGFLRSFEIMQHAKRIVVRSGGQQSASVLDQVAGQIKW